MYLSSLVVDILHVNHVVIVTSVLRSNPVHSVFGEQDMPVSIICAFVFVEVSEDAVEFEEHPVFVVRGQQVVEVELIGLKGL